MFVIHVVSCFILRFNVNVKRACQIETICRISFSGYKPICRRDIQTDRVRCISAGPSNNAGEGVLLCRATCSLVYYALAFNTGTLHGNIYLNSFLSGALEIPAYIASILMVNRRPMGRRWTGCVGLIGSCISSFLCIPMILHSQSISMCITDVRIKRYRVRHQLRTIHRAETK